MKLLPSNVRAASRIVSDLKVNEGFESFRASRRYPEPFAFSTMQLIVQRMRRKLKLPSVFTLDACRHGGMTGLEEAELTDGQGRALSAHKMQQSYEGYAKRNMACALSATRKRHAHRLANASETAIQNEQEKSVQNGSLKKAK